MHLVVVVVCEQHLVQMVLGKLGPGQSGPGHLGPGQLGPGQSGPGAQLSGAQFATFGGRTVGPRTTGPRGPICHFFRANSWALDNWAPSPLVFAMIFLMI